VTHFVGSKVRETLEARSRTPRHIVDHVPHLYQDHFGASCPQRPQPSPSSSCFVKFAGRQLPHFKQWITLTSHDDSNFITILDVQRNSDLPQDCSLLHLCRVRATGFPHTIVDFVTHVTDLTAPIAYSFATLERGSIVSLHHKSG
jgi:hypothetical protein